MKYVEQYDLPCFPDEEPEPHKRTICGIEHQTAGGPLHPDDPPSPGFEYKLWVGGCAVGHAGSLEEARTNLHTYVRRRLESARDEARSRAAYFDGLLSRWGMHERYMTRFEVDETAAASR